MTAPANPTHFSSAPTPHPNGRIVPLTVDQYHIMLDKGILQEGAPIELIDGLLVWKDRSAHGEDPMTVGHRHRLTIQLLMELILPRLESASAVQVQQPITLPPSHEPEPDLTVVNRAALRIADPHPDPAAIYCVIEVSDSSLSYDRTTKQRIYAAAGIPQYIIVNLVAGQVEVYEDPSPAENRYAQMKTISKGQRLALKSGANSVIELNSGEFLP